MKIKNIFLMIFLVFVVLTSVKAIGFGVSNIEPQQTRTFMSLDGKITNATGDPVIGANITVNISSDNDCTGDVYSEVFVNNTSTKGIFDILLGNKSQALRLTYDTDYYLCIGVNGENVGGSQIFRSSTGTVSSKSINQTADYLFNNINASGNITGRWIFANINWSNIKNIPGSLGNSSDEIFSVVDNNTFLYVDDQRYNESALITGNSSDEIFSVVDNGTFAYAGTTGGGNSSDEIFSVVDNGTYLYKAGDSMVGILRISVEDAINESNTNVLILNHTTTGNVGDNISVGILFRTEDDVGDIEEVAQITGMLDDVSNGSESSSIRFYTRDKGGNLVESFIINPDGSVNVTGNVTADYFIGDGSLLTGVNAGNSSDEIFSVVDNNTFLYVDDQRYNDSVRIDSLNTTKLDVDDQRYNESALITGNSSNEIFSVVDNGTFIYQNNEGSLNVNSSNFWDNYDVATDLNERIVLDWENITNKFITAVNNIYLKMSGTTIYLDESQLNATIDAREFKGNSSNEIFTVVDNGTFAYAGTVSGDSPWTNDSNVVSLGDDNYDNVNITANLTVDGSVNITGELSVGNGTVVINGSGLIFPDGSVQKSASSGGGGNSSDEIFSVVDNGTFLYANDQRYNNSDYKGVYANPVLTWIDSETVYINDSTNNIHVYVNISLNGTNGLDSKSSEAADTWYSIWVIENPSTDTYAGLLSVNFSDPGLPNGYSYKKRVGSVYNKADSNFRKFRDVGGGRFYYEGWITVLSAGTATSWAAVDVSSYIPPTSNLFMGYGRPSDDASSAYLYLRAAGDDSNGVILIGGLYGGATSSYHYSTFDVPTNDSQVFEYHISTGDTNANIYLFGYLDRIDPAFSGTITRYNVTTSLGLKNPDYDSGWIDINASQEIVLDHLLGTTNTMVTIEYNKSNLHVDANDENLVGYWRFDNDSSVGEMYNTSTSVVKDYSGESNDGRANGANYIDIGKIEGAFDFDGVDDYISVSISLPATATFEFWATWNGTQGVMPFLAGPYLSGPDLFFKDNLIAWNTWDGTTNSFGAIPADANDGNFHHYSAVSYTHLTLPTN